MKPLLAFVIDFSETNSEEIVIRQVLFNLLQREITEEDFKKCSKFYRHGFPNIYCLCYNKIALGNIEINKLEDHTTVSFTPLPLLN